MYPECFYQGTPYIDEDYAVPTQGSVSPYGGGTNMGSMIPGTQGMPYGQSPMMQGQSDIPFSQAPVYPGTGFQTPMQGYQPAPTPGFQQIPGFQAVPVPQTGTTGGTDFEMEPGSPVTSNINYTQGYLKTLIGRRVKIEFLIGTNTFIDREGTLLQVGISYVVIREVDTEYQVMCDIYSIKFVDVFPVGGGRASTGGSAAGGASM